ncbi:hypothetical protein GFJ94_10665 [Flavobacterium sp. LMO8]|uniref:AsmA-like C-terminal region-containing protein n=1 Tax=Flavobacterium sp. LMO8 TaxID=2654244 RepID=UPI0012923176|nr:AsmA-like C-terminal region-containing protein [Flavobacterium sp. LMO8]MQP25526.1 hypothetical protein [Flavobacterium sp. LMO8]
MSSSKKKILKISGITLIITLLSFLVLPIIFADTITQQVKELANNNLEGELNFKNSNLSFFKNFPSLTLTLNDLDLKGSAPFKSKSLLESQEVGFGINVWSLVFSSETQIDEIYINDAKINILVDKNGNANYNIYKSEKTTDVDSNESATLNLENIQIKNSHLTYKDISTKINIIAKGFEYKGKGNLLKSNFSLKSSAKIDSISFTYDSKEYLKNKKLKADLITVINTNSLSFIFEKNDLIVNKLPVTFDGFFNFITDGYEMDFNLKTANSNLEDLFTALPPEYISWMQKTKMDGKTDASISLKGKYIASTKTNPELKFNFNVRNGFVKHDDAPFPIKNLEIKLNSELPNLDINQLKINIDNLNFDINNSKLNAYFKSVGFGNKITIDTKIASDLDLEIVNKALQIPDINVSGKLKANIVSKGDYIRDQNKFPISKGNFELKNGIIKTSYYPHPISNINLNATLDCSNGYFKDGNFTIMPSLFKFEDNTFNLSAKIKNFEDLNYDIKANGILNISKIYKVFSKKGLDLDGSINANVELTGKQSDAVSGNIHKLKNKGTLIVNNINTNSSLLNKPLLIEKGIFTFNQDKMNFENFIGKFGNSDLSVNGYLLNVIHFVFSSKEILYGKFQLNSNYIDINDLFPHETYEIHDSNEKETIVAGVIEIPHNYNLELNSNIKKIKYNEIQIENLNGNLVIQNGAVTLNNSTLNIINAKATMNAYYKNEGNEKAHFKYNIKASEFDIKRAYTEIPIFREMASSAENAEGIIGINYNLKGVLNNTMEPILPSIEGNGEIYVKKVKIKGFKLLNAVSKKTEKPEILDPDVSEVTIKSNIKNNIINIERFKIKTAGFRLRFEGQTSLDGKLNLKMRVGLPPLGIIGIPINVTGNKDNPHIKLGRKTEELEETEYVNGVTPINTTVPTTTTPSPTIQNDSVPKIEPAVPVEKVD